MDRISDLFHYPVGNQIHCPARRDIRYPTGNLIGYTVACRIYKIWPKPDIWSRSCPVAGYSVNSYPVAGYSVNSISSGHIFERLHIQWPDIPSILYPMAVYSSDFISSGRTFGLIHIQWPDIRPILYPVTGNSVNFISSGLISGVFHIQWPDIR